MVQMCFIPTIKSTLQKPQKQLEPVLHKMHLGNYNGAWHFIEQKISKHFFLEALIKCMLARKLLLIAFRKMSLHVIL